MEAQAEREMKLCGHPRQLSEDKRALYPCADPRCEQGQDGQYLWVVRLKRRKPSFSMAPKELSVDDNIIRDRYRRAEHVSLSDHYDWFEWVRE